MKTLTGIITSNKAAKTVAVKVSKLWTHPVYKKRVKRSKSFLAHDEQGSKVGDKVMLGETRPISKLKHFKVLEIINKKMSQ